MILGVGALFYVVTVLAATFRPDARNWGVHLPAFLSVIPRFALLGLLVLGAGLVVSGETMKGPERDPPRNARLSRQTDGRASRRRGAVQKGMPTRALWFLLVPYGALLWALRVRTQFLGDGAIWFGNAQLKSYELYSEPLFAVIWHKFADFLRAVSIPVKVETLCSLSIASGVIAAVVLVGIAREVAIDRHARVLAALLLLTIGSGQLYFGYIESYPVASLFILGYIWVALRSQNGGPFWPVSVVLALAIAAHLSALFLVPSYWLLASRRTESSGRRMIIAAIPLAAAAALLLVLGYRATNWAIPLQAATRGFRQNSVGPLYHRPYALLSLEHAIDIGNAVLLVLPVPLLLLIGCGFRTYARSTVAARNLAFLATAAVPGALMVASLMTPVAPAQDWDLTAILLLPTAVLGVAVGVAPGAPRLPRRLSLGLVALSVGGLLSFVLVNASEQSSLNRFKVLIADERSVSPYGRAYGNEMLERFYRERKEFAAALPYAHAALAAEIGNPRFWISLGTDLYGLQRYDDAIPVDLEAVRRGPNRWEGRYNLGRCYIETGRYAEAVTTLREAVRLEENRPEPRHYLGIALYKNGQPDSALAVWQQIADRWPHYPLYR